MNAMLPAANSSRRAALMAHALPKDDQAWLLDALPPSRRSMLEPLLIELRALGIPSDPALLAALETQEREEAKEAAAPHARTVDAMATLSPRQVRRLAQVLQQEDPGVASRLLATRRWAWGDTLIAAMDTDFAQQVRIAPARPPARGFDAALCDVLLAKIALPPARRFALLAFLLRRRRSPGSVGKRA